MTSALFIARRYLFSPKSHNAINIVSGVSAAAVMVVTAAMVCVMSVMNGFEQVVERLFSHFDPELRIEVVEGKFFSCDTEAFDRVRALPEVAVFAETIEETALIEFDDKQQPATLKGVDTEFEQLTCIDSILIDGQYIIHDGAFERTVMGQGLAAQMGIGAHFVKPIHLYAPKRDQRVNLMRPDESFEQATCFISGIFAVNQAKYDDGMMLVSLPLAQRLFHYAPHQVTAVELKLTPTSTLPQTQKQIQQILGDSFSVLNRYEQQASFYRMVHIEKLLTAILLVFILLIASFNLIGSLSMLIIDKQNDIRTLSYLGADLPLIRRIFLFEGWLISSIGAVAGIVLGVALCLSQEHFGWLKMGNGAEYILSAYPVALQWSDVAIVLLLVLAIGWVVAWIPAKKIEP